VERNVAERFVSVCRRLQEDYFMNSVNGNTSNESGGYKVNSDRRMGFQ
jgi:hypothetical protein